MISIQNSCIPQGLPSNWEKLNNVQLLQKGLLSEKFLLQVKEPANSRVSTRRMRFFKNYQLDFLVTESESKLPGGQWQCSLAQTQLLVNCMEGFQQRGEIITDAHHIAQPPPQAFLGEIVFLPSPQKPQTCGEGRDTISPKNACGGGYTLPWQQNFSISTNHYPANMAGKKMTELTCMTFLCMIALRNKSVAHTIVLSFGNVNGSLSQERLLRSRNLAAMVT